jgi:hypothetical protein
MNKSILTAFENCYEGTNTDQLYKPWIFKKIKTELYKILGFFHGVRKMY